MKADLPKERDFEAAICLSLRKLGSARNRRGLVAAGPRYRAVLNVIRSLLFAAFALFRTRSQSAIEILALRHQLGVLERSANRPRLANVDRGLWVLLSRRWWGT